MEDAFIRLNQRHNLGQVYAVEDFDQLETEESLEHFLNEAYDLGWSLVGVVYDTELVFKRRDRRPVLG